MRRTALAAPLVSALLACGPGAPLVLPPPTLEGALSMVLSAADRRLDLSLPDAAGLVIHAAPTGEAVELSRALDEGDLRLELLMYPTPLDQLRLPPGPVAPASTGYPLPEGAHVYEAEVVDGEASAWLPRAQPSAALAAFRTTEIGPPRCRPLALDTITVPGYVGFVLPIGADAQTILYGNERGVYALRGREARSVVVVAPPGFTPAAGAVTRAGELAFVDLDGRVGYGDFDGEGLTITAAFTTTRTADRPRYVDGGVVAEGPELFVLSYGGEVTHLYPRGARRVARFPELPFDGEFGGVLRLRSGSALVGAASSTELWMTDRDAPVQRDVAGGVTALGYVEGVGALVGTGRGEVLAEAQSYASLGPSGSAYPITAFGPSDDGGFLFAAAQGAVGTYHPSTGYCFDEAALVPLIPVWIIPRGDEWVLLGKKLVSDSARVGFARRR